MVMYNKIFTNLTNTRQSLGSVCKELDIDINMVDFEVLSTKILNCAHCSIWLPINRCVVEDDIPICSFCEDMTLLRF